MKASNWIQVLALMLGVFALSGCNAESNTRISSSGNIQVWLDQPPSNIGLPLAPFALKAHARDSNGAGVDRIVFLVNTIPVATITTDLAAELAYAEFAWNPSAPGEYQIQAQAFGKAGSGFSKSAFVCVGSNCIPSQPVTPAVPPPPTACKGSPVINSFVALPSSVSPGGAAVLSWSVTNADKVEMAGVGDVPATGTRSVSPASTTTYTLVAMCGGKETLITQTTTVTIAGTKPSSCSGKPEVVAFTASPASITAGASTTLRWTVTNADRVISPEFGDVALTGSQVVSPRTTTTYGLAALCGGKENLVETSVTVNVTTAFAPRTRTPTKPSAQPPPPGCSGTPNVSSFNISSEVIQQGGQVTLSWGAVTNADSVSIDQGVGGVGTPGSTTVTVNSPTTYTLTARCGSNSVTRAVKVTTTAPPPPPPPADKQGPAISGMAYDKSVQYNGVGCGAWTFNVSVNVTDPSGVKSVLLTYRYLDSKGGASNPKGISMNPAGGNSYSAIVNVRDEANAWLNGGNGQVEFWVVARDGLDNSSQNSPATIPIYFCYK